MIDALRQWYNSSFTEEKYAAYEQAIEKEIGEAPLFRLAETPVFIPAAFKTQILQACDDLIDVITRPDYIQFSERSIPPHLHFEGDPGYCPLMVFDFGICQDDKGNLVPQLIEMQGFPSLYCFQIAQTEMCRQTFDIPAHLDNYIGVNRNEYIDLLKKVIIGDADPGETILLDYKPEEQKTKVDFTATKKYMGIDAVCVTDLKLNGKELYYIKDGKHQKIFWIYNRLIFDEFFSMKIPSVDLRQALDVTWIPHPNWFCRISKYTLPFIKSDFAPETQFVSELKGIPDDLEHYVLKPIYSYAGMGVVIDVKREDIEKINDPQNWILQKKVHYHPAILTPDIPAKCEIRMMAVWESPQSRPRIVHNLARLSKGKMIGVRYNADFSWVGSSMCFFE